MLYAPELRNMPPDLWPIITKTAPLYVSQTGLELLAYPRLVLNSQPSCLSLSGSGLHVCVNKPGFMMALDSKDKQRTGVAAQGVREPVVQAQSPEFRSQVPQKELGVAMCTL